MKKIYIKTKKRPKNVRELLKLLYIDKNDNICTEITYSNKQCTIIQCGQNRNRSFKDIYFLCKTYFHNVTPKKVFLECFTLYYDKKHKFPYLTICGTLKDMRFMFNYSFDIYTPVYIITYPNVVDRINECFNKNFKTYSVNDSELKEIKTFIKNEGLKYYNKHYANK